MDDDIAREIRDQDYPGIAGRIRGFLADRVEESGASGLVMGLSGGIDSAVLAYICAGARQGLQGRQGAGGMGAGPGIPGGGALALVMPDTAVTPAAETDDALKMVALTGIDYKLIDIAPIVNEYSMYLEPDGRAKGNLRARVRAGILYYYANAKNRLVLGSSDRSEYLTGYFTKFGDGASDLLPIVSLYKLQVREMARHLGVPERVITKKSSPHLWEDHGAEDELGMPYEQLDPILYCLFDKGLSAAEAARAAGTDEGAVRRVERLCRDSRHKREMPAGMADGRAP